MSRIRGSRNSFPNAENILPKYRNIPSKIQTKSFHCVLRMIFGTMSSSFADTLRYLRYFRAVRSTRTIWFVVNYAQQSSIPRILCFIASILFPFKPRQPRNLFLSGSNSRHAHGMRRDLAGHSCPKRDPEGIRKESGRNPEGIPGRSFEVGLPPGRNSRKEFWSTEGVRKESGRNFEVFWSPEGSRKEFGRNFEVSRRPQGSRKEFLEGILKTGRNLWKEFLNPEGITGRNFSVPAKPGNCGRIYSGDPALRKEFPEGILPIEIAWIGHPSFWHQPPNLSIFLLGAHQTIAGDTTILLGTQLSFLIWRISANSNVILHTGLDGELGRHVCKHRLATNRRKTRSGRNSGSNSEVFEENSACTHLSGRNSRKYSGSILEGNIWTKYLF